MPVSFALTLFVYYVFGYTLNRVTLFALIFVTGIVVDDSIIVVENIVRHFAMKKLPPLQASIAAVNEVGNPTILATLTVIAAVLPMAFVRGLRPYMEPMPVGASLAMAFSLFVALIAAPWLAYRLLRGGAGHEGHEEEGHGIEESRVYRVYRRILLPLLASPRRSWTFLGATFALLLGSVLLVPANLGAAFGVVLILIYLLIIGWFGSFKVPLVMMIAIPSGLVGVLPGHWLFGTFFTATSMIGFIALAGIMVRNSVLLIDFVNLALERGRTLGEAVIEAGAVRFRPILLTAGTVVVGAVVILFDPIFQGLAIALMTGAIASTAPTLVVVPLVYFMTEKRQYEQPFPEAWLPAPPREEAEPPPAKPAEVKA